MKKYFLLAVMTLLTSCYKIDVDNEKLSPGYFCDDYYPCDTVMYAMNCTISTDLANINLVKKAFIDRENIIYDLVVQKIVVKKDTIELLQESYYYSPAEFKKMLIEKNKIQRADDGFYFSPNMEISWKAFDEIFNTYIK